MSALEQPRCRILAISSRAASLLALTMALAAMLSFPPAANAQTYHLLYLSETAVLLSFRAQLESLLSPLSSQHARRKPVTANEWLRTLLKRYRETLLELTAE